MQGQLAYGVTVAWTLSMAGLTIAAAVHAYKRDWARVRRVAGVGVLAALAWPLLAAWLFLAWSPAPSELESSSKATQLARAIATSMNLGTVGFPAWWGAIALWWLARRQQRRAAAAKSQEK